MASLLSPPPMPPSASILWVGGWRGRGSWEWGELGFVFDGG